MWYRLIFIIGLQVLFASDNPLQAGEKKKFRDHSAKHTQQMQRQTISKGSAIHIARSEVRGKVLSARLIKSRGPAVYRVKMLVSDRRVRTVFVDGVSGKVIRIN